MKNKKGMEMALNTVIILVLLLVLLGVGIYMVSVHIYRNPIDTITPITTKSQCDAFNFEKLPVELYDKLPGRSCAVVGTDGSCQVSEDIIGICCNRETSKPATEGESGCCIPKDYCR